MDGFKEKKWFVYFTDHHEGPFSVEEIQGKMALGQVTHAHFVWADGMGEWSPMTSVPAFQSLTSASPASPSLSPSLSIDDMPLLEITASKIAPIHSPMTAPSEPSPMEPSAQVESQPLLLIEPLPPRMPLRCLSLK